MLRKKLSHLQKLLFLFFLPFFLSSRNSSRLRMRKKFNESKLFLMKSFSFFLLLLVTQSFNKFVVLSPSICCLMSPFHSFICVLDFGGEEEGFNYLRFLHFITRRSSTSSASASSAMIAAASVGLDSLPRNSN